MKCFNYNHEVIIQKSKVQIHAFCIEKGTIYSSVYCPLSYIKSIAEGTIYRLVYSVLITTCTVSTFMLKGTVYKVPFVTDLCIFILSPQNNQAPFFLYISPKGIPVLKTLTWSNIIKRYTKYMMCFFKRIKFRYYILICISSSLVCILYRKGDNIQISILICILSPFLYKKHNRVDDIQISI